MGYAIGEPGEAAAVEGLPAMLAGLQPDTITDAGIVGALTVRAASVRGAGHRYDGTPRQDDFCLGVAGADASLLIVAVADGVSAGPKSHLAARAAVRFAVSELERCLVAASPHALDWEAFVGATAGFVLAQARKELGDDTVLARDAARTMATTLVLAIVDTQPGEDGRWTAVVVPLGDTSAWALSGNEWTAITPVKNDGEPIAESGTIALPLLPTDIVACTVSLGAGDALVIMTDGVGDPLGAGDSDVGGTLGSWWNTPPGRHEFAAQVDFARRSYSDDRTAVGVWCAPTAPSGDDLVAVESAADASVAG